MLHAGDRFENPATKESGRIITAAADTEGRYMQAETRLRPGGGVPLAHRHRECAERFEVVVGELTVELDGERRTLVAGEQISVPIGTAHRYFNRSDEDVVFHFEVWPAARFEAMVVTLFALAMEGKTDAKGAPSPLQMAVILDEFDDVLEPVGPPRWLQRLAIPALARIGRARGLRPVYPHHAEVIAAWQSRPSSDRAAVA